jgi:hypothetical protein
MLILRLKKVDSFKPKEWIKKRAYNEHATHVLQSGVQVRDADTDEHVLTFMRVPETYALEPLLETLKAIPYARAYRTDGLLSRSCTFGAQPRIPIRRDFCSFAALAYNNPNAHAVLDLYGSYASEIFESVLTTEYWRQTNRLAIEVSPHWRRSFYTSGIANDRNVLTYHKDQGNIAESLSAMYSVTRDLHGENGRLVLPEYSAALEFDGFEILIFEGAKHVHGVTPIQVSARTALRYTVVYYPLSGLSKCGTPEEELERIKNVKTQRSEMRHSRNLEALKAQVGNGKTDEEIKKAAERKKRLFERKKR